MMVKKKERVDNMLAYYNSKLNSNISSEARKRIHSERTIFLFDATSHAISCYLGENITAISNVIKSLRKHGDTRSDIDFYLEEKSNFEEFKVLDTQETILNQIKEKIYAKDEKTMCDVYDRSMLSFESFMYMFTQKEERGKSFHSKPIFVANSKLKSAIASR